MAYIDLEKSVGIGYLCDWYQNSIMDNVPPVWTDEHLEELLKDFIVIPKDTPTAEVEKVVRCKDCEHYECGICSKISYIMDGYYRGGFEVKKQNDFCSSGKRRDTE